MRWASQTSASRFAPSFTTTHASLVAENRMCRKSAAIAKKKSMTAAKKFLQLHGADVPAGEQQAAGSESAEHEKQGQRLRGRLREIT